MVCCNSGAGAGSCFAVCPLANRTRGSGDGGGGAAAAAAAAAVVVAVLAPSCVDEAIPPSFAARLRPSAFDFAAAAPLSASILTGVIQQLLSWS